MSRLAPLRRPWLRRLIVALLLAPLLLIGLALLLLGTRDGNLWLLHRAQPYMPGQLAVQGWHGSLLTGVRVAKLDYRLDDLRVTLEQLDLNLAPGDLIGGRLHLRHLSAARVSVTPPASPADTGDSGPFTMPDSLTLPLGVRIDALDVGRFELVRDGGALAIERIVGRDLAAWRRFRVQRLALSVADTRIDGALKGSLSSPYKLDGAIGWQRPGAPDAVPAMQGILGLQGALADLTVTHTLSLPMRVVSTGQLGYRDGHLHLDLQHHWPSQPLPVATPVPVTLGQGELSTRGTLDALSLRGQADLSAKDQPLHVSLSGTASTSALTLARLEITSRDQSLRLDGRLDYGDGLAWDLNAQGKHLDPSILAPAWPGKLALDAASQGHWSSADDWAVTVKPLTVDGTLKHTDFHLQGHADQSRGEQLAVDLQGRWGRDRFTAKGRVGDSLKLDGTLKVASLNRWQTDLRGHLDAHWRLRGPLDAPSLSGRLKGGDLAWQRWQIGMLSARFSDLALHGEAMSLNLEARDLNQGDATRADRLTLSAKGSRDRHHLTLTADRREAHTRLDIEAGLDARNRWRGRITQWTLGQPDLGTWRLQQAVPFTLSAERQSLGRLCLAPDRGDGRLCAEGEHRADGGLQAQLDVRDLPLPLANPWLGGELSLAGRARAEARLEGSLDAPRGRWDLHLDGARVTVTGTDTQQTLALDRAELHGTLKDGRVHDKLDLVVAGQGELHADVNNGLGLDQPLGGEVSLSIPRLDDLAPLIPRVSEVKGRIQGRLKLSGTLARPGASGKLALSDGAATVPELGTSADNIELTVAGDPGGLNLTGSARLGEHTLTLDGRWDPARSPLALTVHLSGEKLLVANRSDAKVYVSPDLTLKGDPQGLHLSGKVAVPEAELQPRQLPESAVTVSKDQVLVDAKAQSREAVPFSMAVTITLGDKVHFQGFGLDASLGGELKVTQKPGEPAQLYGDLIIKEGRYRAYGQNLAIENGRLLFQGPPGDPGLDIRAIRKIPSENQVVGVQLSGTLQDPQAHIFSDPQLEESQAMSYLLTGHGLNQGTQGDSAKVAQALALYGLQKGQGVTQKIGSTLGLDSITVGSEWGGPEDAALMLGKQLSDRLYLTYAVGLFDAVSSVMLRYTLTRTLHLEAQSSSKSQSIDLIWEKELK